MKEAKEFADEFLNAHILPVKDGNGVMEAFVRRVQEDALESAALCGENLTVTVVGDGDVYREQFATAIRAILEQRNRG